MSEDDDLNPKHRGLGRGLGALFEDEEGVYPQVGEEGHTPGAQRKTLGIEQLEPNPDQPRQYFDAQALDELAASIQEHGLLQPILVRPHKHTPDMYEIIAGERRWRAAQKAQLHEVPVVIRELDDSVTFQIALIENLQREDLNPIEESIGYQRLIENFDHTPESVGAVLGKSRSHVSNMIRLLQLPQSVQTMVADKKLSMGHARALIKAENPALLAQDIISRGLSVRQAEKLVADTSGRAVKSRRSSNTGTSVPSKDADTIALEKEISNALGMSVSIDMADHHAGCLSVRFKSLDQLDEILRRLSHNPEIKSAI